MENKQIILLVDDEPLMLRLNGSKLTTAGFQVIYAHDGTEALEMARRIPVDLILLDINMPIMDGIETLMHLKEEEATKNVPAIILTSEDLSKSAERALTKDLGAIDYMQKGIPTDEMIKHIKEVLQSDSSKSQKDAKGG